jgi:hypothetical protein
MADEDCYELLLEGEPSGVIEFPSSGYVTTRFIS